MNESACRSWKNKPVHIPLSSSLQTGLSQSSVSSKNRSNRTQNSCSSDSAIVHAAGSPLRRWTHQSRSRRRSTLFCPRGRGNHSRRKALIPRAACRQFISPRNSQVTTRDLAINSSGLGSNCRCPCGSARWTRRQGSASGWCRNRSIF